jgi:hypothetical protein
MQTRQTMTLPSLPPQGLRAGHTQKPGKTWALTPRQTWKRPFRLGAYASDILGAADSDALVTLLGLQAGDIPDLSATYEAVDTEILRADTNDSISADYTITGNWVNTTNPWADNEVSDTITVGNAGTVDPDAISGDTTDDDLIDQDVIEGFAGVSLTRTWDLETVTLPGPTRPTRKRAGFTLTLSRQRKMPKTLICGLLLCRAAPVLRF